MIFFSKYLSSTIQYDIGPSVDDQAVSLSDDGTTIIIDFFSSSFSPLFSAAITVLPERVVVGFPNFAWASNYQKD